MSRRAWADRRDGGPRAATGGPGGQLESEPEERLHRGMPFPTTWDPYFRTFMTVADVYAYPVLHFEHHRHQLTLGT